jgi:translocation and assembly module TamA
LLEGSAEVRWRFTNSWGAVGFFDAGYVTQNSDFSGATTFKTGTGLGARYYTPIGVLRFDLATPLQRESGDSAVAFYIGIGQAF